MSLLVSPAAKNFLFDGLWCYSRSAERDWHGSGVMTSVLPYYVSVWSKSTRGWGKVTQPLPLAQPVSTLKLRQAVIINEETWANGQEMQRYWLGWLPCSKLHRLAPAWWPVVSPAALAEEAGLRKVWNQATASSCLSHPGHTWRTGHRGPGLEDPDRSVHSKDRPI